MVVHHAKEMAVANGAPADECAADSLVDFLLLHVDAEQVCALRCMQSLMKPALFVEHGELC